MFIPIMRAVCCLIFIFVSRYCECTYFAFQLNGICDILFSFLICLPLLLLGGRQVNLSLRALNRSRESFSRHFLQSGKKTRNKQIDLNFSVSFTFIFTQKTLLHQTIFTRRKTVEKLIGLLNPI